MKLKNKIVALALVVASAFGLAVSNHATKVVAADKYLEVTDVNNLANGDQVIIVAKDFEKVMSTSGDTANYRGHEDVTIENDGSIILNSTTAYVLTIIVNSDGTYGFDCGNGNYLGLTNTSNQLHLVTDATSDQAKWTISISEGKTTIFSVYQTNKEIQYNSNNGQLRFATYKSTMKAVTIFEKDAGTVAPELQIAAIKTQVQLGLTASNYTARELPLFTPVTDVTNIENNDKVIIVANNKVMSTSGEDVNFRGQEKVTLEEDSSIILDSATAYVLKIIVNEDGTYGFDCGNGKYLGLIGDSNNLHLVSDVTANSAKWTISISENLASINPISYSARSLNHNASATRFACYEAKSNQSLVTIYKQTGTTMGEAGYTYFSDVKLRFVAEIPSELAAIVDGEFGINITGETAQKDIVLEAKHWNVDTETNDVSFAVVVKVPNDVSKYSVSITGQAYVTVGGERINLVERTCSVNSLIADDYLGGKVSLNETEVAILEGFQKFVAANS